MMVEAKEPKPERHLNWPESFAIVGCSFVAMILLLALICGPYLLQLYAATQGLEFIPREECEEVSHE